MSDSLIYFSGNSETPHHTFQFDKIKPLDVKEAILKGIEIENQELEAIVSNYEAPTFSNTVEAFEKTGSLLENATTYMYNMLSADTNDELEKIAEELTPILSQHSSDILMNGRLWERIRSVKGQLDCCNKEQQMLYEKICNSFIDSGANLSEEGKAELRKVKSELSNLTLAFSQNNLRDTNAFTLHVTEEKDLAGLPDSQIEQARMTAQKEKLDGWVFTLQAPSYVPFMTYSANRELRKRLYMAYNTKCTHGNENNNFEIVRKIVNLRQEKAKILGYENYADLILRHRMAANTANVYDLLQNLLNSYKGQAIKEVEAVRSLAEKEEGANFDFMPWDFSYYAHKLQRQLYNLDSEMLRPYFELSSVIKGVFALAEKLYGIRFERNRKIPVYHPDVEAYEVYDENGEFLAVLYTDYFPRASKQAGAWMTNYKEEWDGTDRPHVAIVMNLSKPTESKPALLTLSEVETFLHEFGHALHGIFAKTKYRSLSGTNVYWDFVELPSQFMENYAIEQDFLTTFAKHYQTGETIPAELIERIVAARNFNVAYACIRQVSFGLLDMAYYTLTSPLTEDVRTFEHKAWADAKVLPEVEEACMSVQFGHIMSGGYSAGYYSYKWAEVLDADAFSLFKECGIFNRDLAKKFRDEVLSLGGTKNPMELYVNFRGRRPCLCALLKRNGIAQQCSQHKGC